MTLNLPNQDQMDRDTEAMLRGRYRMLHSLGAGSGGRVYKAVQLSTGQSVAIKVLTIDDADSEALERRLERFRREIAICSELYHPDVVRLLDSGILGPQRHFAVFEFIPGFTLGELLQAEGSLTVQRARALLLQLLPPLQYAHQKGISHRDLKPNNIMVTPDTGRDRVKILDFGISIATGREYTGLSRLTLTHEWVGTPTYAAPEQLRGESTSNKSDLYAWGLIFVECLTGSPLIKGRSLAEVVKHQLLPGAHALPPALARHRLGALLSRVLEKDPARRPEDAGLILSMLERISVDDLAGPQGYLSDAAQESTPLRAPVLTETVTDGRQALRSEQRQATVLCCRVGLTGAVSPASEDLDGLLDDANAVIGEVLRQFGASPVQSLGMYSLAYFGLVQARDDDARSAMRGSLELAHRLDGLQRLMSHHSQGLCLRVGIADGSVTAQLGPAGRQPIAGVTARLAMRLAEVHADLPAGSTRILVTETFRRLISRHAELSPYAGSGAATPDGADTVERVYQLMGESRASQRGKEALPFVGRSAEMAILLEAYRTASAGSGCARLIVGEAGMGKSRLAREFMVELEAKGLIGMQARCLPEWQHAFLRPLAELFTRELGIATARPEAASEQLERRVRELGLVAAEAVPLFCIWLSLPLPQGYAPLAWSPQKQRQLLHQCLADALIASLERGGAFLVEDLHWADPSTLECLDTLLKTIRGRSAFIVMTSRSGRPSEWSTPPEELSLAKLEEPAVIELISSILPDSSDRRDIVQHIAGRSDGVPLFAEELALAMRASILPEQSTAHAGPVTRFTDPTVPVSLRALLTSRLDDVGAAKQTAQFAAALGREFSLDRLAILSEQDELALLADLEQLVSARVLVRRLHVNNPIYSFRHALIADNAYEEMSADGRQRAHERIAFGMELRLPELGRSQPGILAYHFECAGNVAKALHYWQLAASRSRIASAHVEALHQIDRAIALAERLPASKASPEQRAELLLARGATLVAKRGYTDGEAMRIFENVVSLLPLDDSSTQIAFAARLGLWHFHITRVDTSAALDLAHQLQSISSRAGDTALAISAWGAVCQTEFLLGNLEKSIAAARSCAARYDFERDGQLAMARAEDPYLAALSFEALAEILCGRHALAVQRVEEGLALAAKLGDAGMRAGMHGQAAWMYLVRGSFGARSPELKRAREHATLAASIAREHGFAFWEVNAAIIDAAARAVAGESMAVNDLKTGFDLRRQAGAAFGSCWHLSFIGQGLWRQGQHSDAVLVFEQALEFCERTDSRYFEPEVRRNLAEVLVDATNPERDVERGWREFERAEAAATRIGASWCRLAVCMSQLRFRQTPKGVADLQTLVSAFASCRDEPPLLIEARAQLGNLLTATEGSAPGGR